MTTEDLAPCPYCGGDAHHTAYRDAYQAERHNVECMVCGAEAGYGDSTGGLSWTTKEAAYKQWNNRAPQVSCDVETITAQGIQLIIDYIEEGDPDMKVIVSELKELILRGTGEYFVEEKEHVSSKPVSYDQSKVDAALNSGKRIELPSGLSKEQKRQFILSSR